MPILAIGSASPTSFTDDQIVVSVGPYMFKIRADVARRRSPTKAPGSASPPTISVFNPDSVLRASSFIAIIRAIEGVHCRCVTPWRMIWAAME